MKLFTPILNLGSFAFALIIAGLICFTFFILQINKALPDAESIKNVELKVPLRVYSADNLLISEFGNERRKPTAIADIPKSLIDAVLASEDNNFYRHQGIDVPGLIRAVISNARSNGRGQGASTITMQVARNFFLTPEKTYTRKLKEILLSIKLEQILDKDEILALYINKIFLGHRAYGFGAAADVYYGRQLHELSLAETAMLAGLPQAPSASNPLRNPQRAVARRNYVLGRLLSLGKISDEEHKIASSAEVTATKRARKVDLAAPHIAEMVRQQLIQSLGENAYWAGLNVYTTIDSKQQLAAQRALRKGLQSYDQRHGFRGPIAELEIDAAIQAGSSAEELTKYYQSLLSEFPSSQEQVAALITDSQETVALAQTRDFGEIKLRLKDAAWAKRHRTANSRAATPTSMADFLNIGDVVYVQPTTLSKDKNRNGKQLAENKTDWRLSQIPNVSGALISIEPASGKILSLVGGYDFFLNKYNRATQSIRQPGSNIKPFIYSAALDKGFTPASLISGAPIVMTDPTHGTVWRPENYSGRFFGPTRIREALTKSLNLVSIRLLRAIGIPYAREYLTRFGIDMSRFSPTLTMALGSGGISPLELLSAYSVLANSGYKVNPYFIDYISDRDGNVIYRASQPELCDECYSQYLPAADLFDDIYAYDDPIEEANEVGEDEKTGESDALDAEAQAEISDTPTDVAIETYQAPRIMSLANNYQTVSMLKDVVKLGTARKALVLERPDIAGKTGTTNDYVDAWFTGFNSQIASTVWVGFDDPQSMGRGEAGSVAALPIWVDFMRTALQGIPTDSEEIPYFIEPAWVNKTSGQRTNEFDPDAVAEYFPRQIPESSPLDGFYGFDDDYLELTEGTLDDAADDGIDNDALDGDLNNRIDDPFNEQSNNDLEASIDQQNNNSSEPSFEENTLEEIAPTSTGERIIENEEDTEGLF